MTQMNGTDQSPRQPRQEGDSPAAPRGPAAPAQPQAQTPGQGSGQAPRPFGDWASI